ncbi:hypothetical protein BJ165DRAFT_1427889 [Panaeolus papilionaceus]|nr:hypothetical protein BJ165DRAFT_1427889 [Panaeolus papilionaceus]
MTTLYQTPSVFRDFGLNPLSPSLSVDSSPSFFQTALDSPHCPPSMASSMTNDSFHGHKEVALTTSEFIHEKFGCSLDGDSSDESFCYGLDLPHFIAQCIHLGGIPYNYIWGTVLLLMRYHDTFDKGWDKAVDGATPLLGHSMFLCALYYTTQEHFDPTGRTYQYGDSSIWVEMTGFSMDETALHEYFWDFFTNLSGNVDVECHLDAVPKADPDCFEPPPSRGLTSKELSKLPKPPDLCY